MNGYIFAPILHIRVVSSSHTPHTSHLALLLDLLSLTHTESQTQKHTTRAGATRLRDSRERRGVFCVQSGLYEYTQLVSRVACRNTVALSCVITVTCRPKSRRSIIAATVDRVIW